jgi:alpha-ribazole phosphatase
VADFLDELKIKSYQKVAVFTHGGVLACAQIYAGLLEPENVFTSSIPYGSITNMIIK